jgi:hypothetical protein
LLFLATAGIGVWSAYDRPVAWAKFWLIVGALLLFYAMFDGTLLDNPPHAWLLTIFGIGVATYFLLTHDWEAGVIKYAIINRMGVALQAPFPTLPGHRMHPNVVGGMVAMTVPYAGILVFENSGKGKRVLAIVATIFLLLALLLTASRGAWLAVGGACLVAGGWWLVQRIVPASYRTWLVLGVMGLVFAGMASVMWQLVNPGRQDLYRDSLVLTTDYPLIGGGLGGFMMLHASYVFLSHVGFSIHAHNLFLNLAIEQGTIALIAIITTWGLVGWHILRTPKPAPLLIASALSIVIIALHGLVDDALYGSRGIILLFIPLATSGLLKPSPTNNQQPTTTSTRKVATVLLVIAGLIASGRFIVSTVYGNLATVQQSRAELSVYKWPQWDIQDSLRRSLDLNVPIANYEQALAWYPQNRSASRRYGQVLLSLGEYEKALVVLENAGNSEPARQLLGEAYLLTGNTTAGNNLLDTVSNAQGQLVIRKFWYDLLGENFPLE